jgi:DNA-binding GntR family transcriptional regulator
LSNDDMQGGAMEQMEHAGATPREPRARPRGADDSITLSEQLQNTLEDLIVSGVLKPGERLDEAELVERFKVSRTPVREALKALAGTGFVEMRKGQGVTVATISLPVLIEMFEMTAVMEGVCAKFAARRATPAQKQGLAEVHERLTEVLKSGDHARFFEVNQEFHDALYDASNTEYVAEQTRTLRKRVGVYRRYVTYQPGRMAATIGEHQRIIAAIERHDPQGAFDAAAAHVSLLGDDLVDLIAAIPAHMTGSS